MIRLIEDNREAIENLLTRFRVRLSLFVIATCLLAFKIPVCFLNNAYAKQTRNETINNKPLVEVTLRLEGKTVQGKPKVVSSKNTYDTSVSADIVLGLKKLPIIIGEPIKEIVIDWKDGDTGKLSDLRGKTVVLDVWATWCGPCIRAFPELNSLATELSNDSNIVFIALSIDNDEAIWKKMVDEANWKALRHGRLNRIKNSFVFNRPIPYSMIIDKNGIVRAEGNGLDIRLELEKLSKNSHKPSTDIPERSIKN